jgi:hypothetical protein
MSYTEKYNVKKLAEATKIPLEDLILCSVEDLTSLAKAYGYYANALLDFSQQISTIQCHISKIKKNEG